MKRSTTRLPNIRQNISHWSIRWTAEEQLEPLVTLLSIFDINVVQPFNGRRRFFQSNRLKIMLIILYVKVVAK